MNGAIQKATTTNKPAKKGTSMKDYVEQMKPAIAAALPSVMTPDRFTRICLSALSANPKLQECTPSSFLGAMMTAAQLGVEPNTPLGQAYLIPYNNNKAGTTECQFQLGYKGLMDLAYRSGDVTTIQAQAVYQNDDFHYSYGLEPELRHVPAMGERGEPTCFYALFKTKSGGFGFEVMSKSDVDKYRQKYSKARSSPWDTAYEEMAKKTVLKKVLKYAPLKSDFIRAVASDEAIRNEISDDMLNLPAEYYESEDYEIVGESVPVVVVDKETGEVLDDDRLPL